MPCRCCHSLQIEEGCQRRNGSVAQHRVDTPSLRSTHLYVMHVILDDSTQIRATLTRGEPEASRRDERIPGWGMISGIIFLDSSCGDLRNIRAGNLSSATFWFCDKLVCLLAVRIMTSIPSFTLARRQRSMSPCQPSLLMDDRNLPARVLTEDK